MNETITVEKQWIFEDFIEGQRIAGRAERFDDFRPVHAAIVEMQRHAAGHVLRQVGVERRVVMRLGLVD